MSYGPFTKHLGDPQVVQKAVEIIDENVRRVLPLDCTDSRILPCGSSLWTRTARIETFLKNEPRDSYFIKVFYGEVGRAMMRGEFESLRAIYAVTPAFVPEPIGHGTYASDSSLHFFLVSFREMSDAMLDIDAFAMNLAKLHTTSQSPDDSFGFHITTYAGTAAQDNSLSPKWETFFTQAVVHMLHLEELEQGSSAEMATLAESLIQKVIPRLLRPMETNGRKIKPSLVHGDLWRGNLSTDRKTASPIIFDACSFYAHNEYELGRWRTPHYKMSKEYVTTYQKYNPVSEPKHDFDDRNALYSLVIQELRRLVGKYPDGFDGYVEDRKIASE